MKIQVHHNELTPMIKEGYEKVYDALGKLLSTDEFIFAEWKAGFGDMLQWTLPSETEWIALTNADSYDRNAVIKEFLRLKAIGESKLGKNKKLIESVYSVPAENFVYYSIDQNGRYRIMLCGWGYSYPHSAPMTILIGSADPALQPVTLRFIENSEPMAGLRFDIPRKGNRIMHLTAEDNGEKALGSMSPGSAIRVIIPSVEKKFDIQISKGKEFYTIDLTSEVKTEIPAEIPPIQDNPVNEGPINEPDNAAVRNRDISIKFLGFDGKPIIGNAVYLSQTGKQTLSEETDSDGRIYLDKNDFASVTPLEISLNGQYPKTETSLDENETEYEIIFHEKRSSSWLLQLIICLLAIAAAAGTWIAVSKLLNL